MIDTVLHGERFSAKFNRLGFRKVFVWQHRAYSYKEVEAITVEIPTGMLVLTVIARYFYGQMMKLTFDRAHPGEGVVHEDRASRNVAGSDARLDPHR